ncbi:hypothetical protein ACOMHN_033315 [Nucella lapillus]
MLPRNFLLRGAYGHRPLPCIQGKLGQRAKGTKAPRPRGAGVVPPSKLHVQTVFGIIAHHFFIGAFSLVYKPLQQKLWVVRRELGRRVNVRAYQNPVISLLNF